MELGIFAKIFVRPSLEAVLDEVKTYGLNCVQFNMACAKGTVGVFFSMAPTQPPRVQHLAFQKLATETERLGAPTGPPAGVSCSQ